MGTSSSIPDIYMAARAGEASSIARLIDVLEPELRTYVSSNAGAGVLRWQSVDDICQSVLGTFLQRLSSFPEDLSADELRAYLFQLAKWQVLSLAARTTRDAGESEVTPRTAPADSPTTGVVTHEDDRRWLGEVIERLPAIHAEVLRACVLEARPREEVARQMGLSEATLAKRLSRARQELQRLVGRRDDS